MNNQEDVRYLFDYKEGKLFENVRRSNIIKIGNKVGSLHLEGYAVVRIFNKEYKVHRLIWVYHNGPIPKGKEIDHINHIRDDNRIENLRLVTQKDNARNCSLSKNNTSGVQGVMWHKATQKWLAQIRNNKKQIHLGVFENKEEAIKSRKDAEKKYGYHPNSGKKKSKDFS